MKQFKGLFPNTEATKELLDSYDMKKSTEENPIYTQVEGVCAEMTKEVIDEETEEITTPSEPTGMVQADIFFTIPNGVDKKGNPTIILPTELIDFRAEVTGQGNTVLRGEDYQKNKL